jgi:hypothetical protein
MPMVLPTGLPGSQEPGGAEGAPLLRKGEPREPPQSLLWQKVRDLTALRKVWTLSSNDESSK